MSDLRDKLFDAIEEVMTKRWEGGNLYRVNSSELVDAVIAIFKDPPAEVVERVAVAISGSEETGSLGHARDVLAALVGGEQG